METKHSTPSTSSNSKVDASTSCLDLINESNPCNEKCFENVIVESCDDLIAKENDELKQEVQRFMKNLAKLKGKGIESNVQPSQDNREDMVKKLEKGSTVTCSKCHKKVTSLTSALNQRRSLQSRVLSSTPSSTGGTRAIAPPI